MIEELIARIFATLNLIRLNHWKESSGFRHETLGEFYDQLASDLDEIVECHIGAGNELGIVQQSASDSSTSLLDRLAQEADWINVNTSNIADELRAIESLLDVMVTHYLRVIYKLKKLK